MPTPGEHKTVQARILAYAQELSWAVVPREEAERRRGFNAGATGSERARGASLYFEEVLDAQVRYFNPSYTEAEVKLTVAAEAAVHPGAQQAVVRRGPGRPPKSGALTTTAAHAIEEFLGTNPGWHGKSAILAATGTDAAAWNAAIMELLEGGKVERQGEKKGARYRAN